jgi:hypothetical protein
MGLGSALPIAVRAFVVFVNTVATRLLWASKIGGFGGHSGGHP